MDEWDENPNQIDDGPAEFMHAANAIAAMQWGLKAPFDPVDDLIRALFPDVD